MLQGDAEVEMRVPCTKMGGTWVRQSMCVSHVSFTERLGASEITQLLGGSVLLKVLLLKLCINVQ